MDPQKLASLDPKLRDAYQRVMGTPIPQPQPVPQPQQPLTPQPEPVSEPQSSMSTTPPTAGANNFLQMNSEVAATPSQNFTSPSAMSQPQTTALKKKNGMMMPILFGIVALVFIAIYTLFWAKIFNFKLPFLP